MELLQLQLFVSVAETGSFSASSEREFISLSSLSRHIRDLEFELGVTLFSRSKNRVVLTPEGSILLKKAKEVLQSNNSLKQQAFDISSSRTGYIEFGYSGYWDYAFVSSIVCNFSNKYAFIDLVPTRKHHGKLNRDIRKGLFDLVFTLDSVSDLGSSIYENVAWIPLAQSQLYVYASENSWLASKTVLTMKDIEDEKQIFVSQDSDTVMSTAIMKGYLDEGLVCQCYPFYPTNTQDIFLLVAAGKGISLSTKFMKLINMPGVVAIPLQSSIPDFQYGIAYRTDRNNDAISCLLDEIKSAPLSQFTDIII